MHHKKLVLPVHCIKMAWDDISLPIYDRGFDWMVILYKLEYDCLKIQTVLPILLHSVMTLSVMDFWLDERGAALRMCRDSTAKIITYSWDVETIHCVSDETI